MFDVVIIGSGAAGLTTALNISQDLAVLVLTACQDCGANTKLAQGGIAASWHATEPEQELHILDTLVAGSHQNDLAAVKQLIGDSSTAVDFLINHGTNFDMVDGQYDLTAEGAHSCRRIFHAGGDSTGKLIYEALLAAAIEQSNITISNSSLVNNVSELGLGHYQVTYTKADTTYQIETNNLVIASGGYGNLFKASTNSKYINGCNLIIANQLDLAVSNLQYLQFHPTGFKDVNDNYHLLTESLRGEGARFYSPQSGYFMSSYHKLGDIAPRDVASRAVHHQIKQGHQVFLDCRDVAAKLDIHSRFRTVSNAVKISGYDLATDLIPICPVAHYSIGGINIDLIGRTSKPGVYAVGEAAMSGVHGANRLASNSLLECVVYGMRTAQVITKSTSFKITKAGGEQSFNSQLYNQIQNILSTYCNIVRTDTELQTGYEQLIELEQELTAEPIIKVAKSIIDSCLKAASIGCHFKENHE